MWTAQAYLVQHFMNMIPVLLEQGSLLSLHFTKLNFIFQVYLDNTKLTCFKYLVFSDVNFFIFVQVLSIHHLIPLSRNERIVSV